MHRSGLRGLGLAGCLIATLAGGLTVGAQAAPPPPTTYPFFANNDKPTGANGWYTGWAGASFYCVDGYGYSTYCNIHCWIEPPVGVPCSGSESEDHLWIREDGEWTLHYYSSDDFGQAEPERTWTFRIDTTPPMTPSGDVRWISGPVDTTLLFRVTDADGGPSGLDTCWYRATASFKGQPPDPDPATLPVLGGLVSPPVKDARAAAGTILGPSPTEPGRDVARACSHELGATFGPTADGTGCRGPPRHLWGLTSSFRCVVELWSVDHAGLSSNRAWYSLTV